jgi:hypothetical protein
MMVRWCFGRRKFRPGKRECGKDKSIRDTSNAAAAPATVDGELSAACDHWDRSVLGRSGKQCMSREPGNLPIARRLFTAGVCQ